MSTNKAAISGGSSVGTWARGPGRPGLFRELLCTLGPATLGAKEIGRLTELGACLFRINLSHTSLSSLPGTIERIREHTEVPICLDSEGAQIRTGRLSAPINVRDQAVLRIHGQPIVGDGADFSFYPSGVIGDIQVGDLVSIDFNSVVVQVIEKSAEQLTVRVLNGGLIGQNKAVSVMDRDVPMPVLTLKDREAMEIGRRCGIKHVALSFARRASDIDEMLRAAGEDAYIIAKIECREALENLQEIAARTDALLIDRGDLSREVSIERIPALQKTIIRAAKRAGKPIYVATNLLESMIASPTPTRAEVNDIYNTLLDGADGLVLAAETAVGKYPLECAAMVVRVIGEFEREQRREAALLATRPASLLVEPHGGELVQRERLATEQPVEYEGTIALDDAALLDCELIANGTFSPLTRFLGRDDFESVLERYRLADGRVWPSPVILQVREAEAQGLKAGRCVGLSDSNGAVRALLEVTEAYKIDVDQAAKRWFGTTAEEHPGVARLRRGGPWLAAGRVTLLRRAEAMAGYLELSPAQIRSLFVSKGWSRVVAFQTRNVILRVHEHIQMRALEMTGADGLLVTPLFEPKRAGEWTLDAIIKSYQLMIDCGFYRRGQVVLSPIRTYPRYDGAREVVLSAICRKNMGCSHFIVGREEAGGNGARKSGGTRALLDDLGDMGIVPLYIDVHGWNAERRAFTAAGQVGTSELPDGAAMREQVRKGTLLPDYLMRPEVQDMLRGALAERQAIFAG